MKVSTAASSTGKEHELIENEKFDSYVPREEPSGCPIQDYITSSKGERLMEDSMKTTAKVATRRVVTGIVEEPVEDIFKIGLDDWRKE